MASAREIFEKFHTGKGFTPAGWIAVAVIALAIWLVEGAMRHYKEAPKTEAMAQAQTPSPQSNQPQFQTNTSIPGESPIAVTHAAPPSPPPPPATVTAPPSPSVLPTIAGPKLNSPSFGNVTQGKKIMSDDFIPKSTIIYATLVMDIVSNNQISPVVAVVVQPVVSAHKMLVPVGARITGKIAPGNLRGRVFVNFDTIVFIDEGRQGHELPIKGTGLTYEENEHSGRWIINGAGLKGYLYDDSTANMFKLAVLQGTRDFLKTLETYTLTQNSVINGATTITSSVQQPNATLQNSGLAAGSTFIDTIAKQMAITLQQNNSFVLVPTARMCAIYLDEAADVAAAAPGKSGSS